MCCGFNIACCTKPREENPFANPKVKRRFIWRVLLILDGCLICTLIPTFIFLCYPPAHSYIAGTSYVFAIPAIIAFIVVQAFLCFAMKLLQKRPVKIIFFIIWIIVHTILLTAVSVWFEPWVTLIPCGILAFVILAMVVYSRFVRCQIGHKIPLAYLVAAGLVVIIHAILLGFFFKYYWFLILVSFSVVLILIMVVVLDIDLIVRDKTRHKFGKHEYIVASMIILRDVIWIVIIVIIILIAAASSCNCCGDDSDHESHESNTSNESNESGSSGSSASSGSGGSSS